MNQSDLAKAVCDREGLKIEVDIAQVKEVLARTWDVLYGLPQCERNKLIASVVKSAAKRAGV